MFSKGPHDNGQARSHRRKKDGPAEKLVTHIKGNGDRPFLSGKRPEGGASSLRGEIKSKKKEKAVKEGGSKENEENAMETLPLCLLRPQPTMPCVTNRSHGRGHKVS